MSNKIPARALFALLIAATLAGCGGGGGGGASPASVASVTSGTLMYGKPATFTVSGQNLDQGIAMVAPNCAGIAEASGGSATARTFTCTPNATGTLSLAIQSGAGATLLAVSPVVPLPQVTMKTTLGDMLLELYPSNAPITVGNFLQYVNAGFYTNLLFHRVLPGFVIQGGGVTTALQLAATNAPIKLEMPNGLSNLRGSVAMARTSVPDSATSQFFINLADANAALDTASGGYAVFGKVVTGMGAVDAIAAVPTQAAIAGLPVTQVVINSMTQTQ